MRIRSLTRLGAISACFLLIGAATGASVSGAQTSNSSGGAAFGVQLQGPVPIPPTPTVEASVSGPGEDEAEDSLVHVPAAPLAESFTALVQAGGSSSGGLDARLQAIIEREGGMAPAGWNGRGYAVVEDLVALVENLKAQVIESESVAGCMGGELVLGSASRVVGLTLGGNPVPIPGPGPNQELVNQGGIRIVLWETNWDPESGGTTDDSDTVWTNALRVTAPGGVDLTVAHSEATADCAPESALPPPPAEAPPADEVLAEPPFTG